MSVKKSDLITEEEIGEKAKLTLDRMLELAAR